MKRKNIRFSFDNRRTIWFSDNILNNYMRDTYNMVYMVSTKVSQKKPYS